jgi:hypothetical protein
MSRQLNIAIEFQSSSNKGGVLCRALDASYTSFGESNVIVYASQFVNGVLFLPVFRLSIQLQSLLEMVRRYICRLNISTSYILPH